MRKRLCLVLSSPGGAQMRMVLHQGWFSPKGAAHSAQGSLELLSGSARGTEGAAGVETPNSCAKFTVGSKLGALGQG